MQKENFQHSPLLKQHLGTRELTDSTTSGIDCNDHDGVCACLATHNEFTYLLSYYLHYNTANNFN